MDSTNYQDIISLCRNDADKTMRMMLINLTYLIHIMVRTMVLNSFINYFTRLVKNLSKVLNNGKVILVPCTLGGLNPFEIMPQANLEYINSCDIFIVENLRSARRFLKKIGIQKDINELDFFEIYKRTKKEDIPTYLSGADSGKNIGVLSSIFFV